MKRVIFLIFILLTSILVACAQTMQFTPRTSDKNYQLPRLRLSAVDVQVNDLRPEMTSGDSLRSVLRAQVIAALSQDPPGQQSPERYILTIDVIEHRSFFTPPSWNASTRLRIRLADSRGAKIGQWEVSGNQTRWNWSGYATAAAVSQEAYDKAVADMMSSLSQAGVAIKVANSSLPISGKTGPAAHPELQNPPEVSQEGTVPPSNSPNETRKLLKKIDVLKIAVWDLNAGNINPSYAQDLTSILVSEINKVGKYEVYSQENVRTLAGWTAERMRLGCTDTKCLTALGQMDIAKLISGRIGKIGNTYSISLHLFDTQNVRAENSISEECKSEDELIPLVRRVVRKLLGMEVGPSEVEEKGPGKTTTGLPSPLPARSFVDPVTGIEFVFIKGGCFEMGDTLGDGDKIEKPVHEVCVDDFYLGKYEVTMGEFRKFVDATGYRTEAEKGDGCFTWTGEKWEVDRSASWRSPGFPINDKHPVVCISWDDAVAYARWMEGRGGKNYRLPTEAEWEYAAKGGGKKIKYSWGNGEPSGNIADESGKRRFPKADIWSGYDDGYVYTAPVGSYRPNGFGLYDMTGNVWEWCSDWYDGNYYQRSPKDNPSGPANGQQRVLRGGGWDNSPWVVRAAMRHWVEPEGRSTSIGFRLGASAR